MKRVMGWAVIAAAFAGCFDGVKSTCHAIALGSKVSSLQGRINPCLPSGGEDEVGPVEDLWCCNAGREFNQSLFDGGCEVDCSLPQFAPFDATFAGPFGQNDDGINEACCVLSRDGGVIGHFIDQD